MKPNSWLVISDTKSCRVEIYFDHDLVSGSCLWDPKTQKASYIINGARIDIPPTHCADPIHNLMAAMIGHHFQVDMGHLCVTTKSNGGDSSATVKSWIERDHGIPKVEVSTGTDVIQAVLQALCKLCGE